MNNRTSKTVGQYSVGRSNNFDLLRLIAAVLVMYAHSFPLSIGQTGDLLYKITKGSWTIGNMAVAIFFIISGFLVSQSYDNSNSAIKYSKSRILRIFPGLGISLLAITFIIGPLVTNLSIQKYFSNPQTYQYLKTFFLYPIYWVLPGCFTNNATINTVNGSLWTIPFEVICYVVLCILGVLGALKFKKIVLFIFITNYFYYIFGIVNAGPHLFGLQVNTMIELFSYFSAGMLIYAYRNYIPLNKHYVMISIFILYLSTFFIEYKYLFVIFGSYIVIYCAFATTKKMNGIGKFGDLSYGLYIYAYPVQQSIVHLFGGHMNPYLNVAIALPITITIAFLSWHIVEKNCLKLKKNFNIKKVWFGEIS